jgi:AcrR family transcriptional regulator
VSGFETPAALDTRTRILEAAVACVERHGLTKTSLEDVASQAGLSRATLYRWFPGGRDELVSCTVAWELEGFLRDLTTVMDAEPDLQAKLVRGLVHGHQAIVDHQLLQRILNTEPEALLGEFHSRVPLLGDLAHAYLADQLRRERLRPGVEVSEAADYLARLFLSYLGSQGGWDLTDDDAVRRLVQTQFLAGIVLPSA